jgi:phospholipid/cholesterol/gamma-HCH transport system permease protein
MGKPADFRLEAAREGGRLALVGDWTSTGMGRAGARLAEAVKAQPPRVLDLSELGRFDTAGAYELIRATGLKPDAKGLETRPDAARLVELVAHPPQAEEKPAKPPRPLPPIYKLLIRAGQGVADIGHDIFATFAFVGRLLEALGRLARNPSRIRVAPTVSLMERAGLDALPIVAATNFFVGATLGFLGAKLLAQFGASVFTVEMIGIGVLREFGVLITAVILAGRSASSFAAELGAMKMNQEVDAMRTMGVDPYEALVIPRFVAMLFMTPLLTFVAVIAGLFGGLLVVWAVLSLSPAFFLQRLGDNVGVTHFWVGMSKAPVMAIVVAAIGCRQGLEVGGDVEQLGRRVTTAVVQALFAIIVLDAAFAMLFLEMDI